MSLLRDILLIQRDLELRQTSVEILRENGFDIPDGYDLVEADDIETAWLGMEGGQREFAAIVTAWKNPTAEGKYPSFDGIELLNRLRAHSIEHMRQTPVIVLTNDGRCERLVRMHRSAAVVEQMEAPTELPRCLHDMVGTHRV